MVQPNFINSNLLLIQLFCFYFTCQDHKGTQLYLGINHHGILTFQGSKKTNHFRWSEVQKINYEGKMFIVHLTITEVKYKNLLKNIIFLIYIFTYLF